jgi:hypothetical protein
MLTDALCICFDECALRSIVGGVDSAGRLPIGSPLLCPIEEGGVSGASIGLRRAACILVVVATAATVTGAARVKAATAGWQGEAIISLPATGDGWEPAVAADPAQPYVYSAWMQYSGPGVSIYERTSADDGST